MFEKKVSKNADANKLNSALGLKIGESDSLSFYLVPLEQEIHGGSNTDTMKVSVDVDLREDQLALPEVQFVLQNPEKFSVMEFQLEKGSDCCACCNQKFGEPHLLSCTCVFKRVHVHVAGRCPVENPAHWNTDYFEQQYPDCNTQELVQIMIDALRTAIKNGYSSYGEYLKLGLLKDHPKMFNNDPIVKHVPAGLVRGATKEIMDIGLHIAYEASTPVYWTDKDFMDHWNNLSNELKFHFFAEDLDRLNHEEQGFYGEIALIELLDDGHVINPGESHLEKLTEYRDKTCGFSVKG